MAKNSAYLLIKIAINFYRTIDPLKMKYYGLGKVKFTYRLNAATTM